MGSFEEWNDETFLDDYTCLDDCSLNVDDSKDKEDGDFPNID